MNVCVTGMGVVSPLGVGVEANWTALLEGRSGIGPITRFDASALPTRIAGEARDFRPETILDARELRRNDRFIHLALAAADEALRSSGIDLERTDRDRVGVVVGSGMGGLETLEETHEVLRTRGHRKVSPFFIPSVISNLAPGQISLRHGLRGPNFAPVSACATGNHALGEALLMIEHGMADVMLAGGAEATLTPLGLAGFVAARAMSERNEDAARASRPFDLSRDGFVAAEGAGILVLEHRAHAEKRGANILAELVGYGASADAHHITSPAPGGEGARRAMRAALRMAGCAPADVGYINAHATSTPLGDQAECEAIRAVFRATPPPVSSSKGLTGHLLGAAGGVEAIFCVLALQRGVLPATAHVEQQDPACALDVIPNVPREARVRRVLSNGFGFGGTNASVVLQRPSR